MWIHPSLTEQVLIISVLSSRHCAVLWHIKMRIPLTIIFNSLTISLQKDLREIYQKKKKKERKKKQELCSGEAFKLFYRDRIPWEILENRGRTRKFKVVSMLITVKIHSYYNINTYRVDSIPTEDRAALWPLIEEILLDHHPYSEVPLPIPPFLCFPKVTLCWLLPTSNVNVSHCI